VPVIQLIDGRIVGGFQADQKAGVLIKMGYFSQNLR